MAGLIDLFSRGEIDRSSNGLLAHLGGQPAIDGYASLFRRPNVVDRQSVPKTRA
jgi:hypothetical protein